MRGLRAFLDANVIVDAQVRDFFFTAGELGLLEIRWSEEVLEEVKRALITRLLVAPQNVARLLEVMTIAFPHALVAEFADESTLNLPDQDDIHVLAAAIGAECDLLVTQNIRDFPDDRIPPGAELAIVTADEAILELATTFPTSMPVLVERVVGRLSNPPVSILQYVQRLEARAPLGAAMTGAIHGLDNYIAIVRNTVAAQSDSGPFETVRILLDILRRDAADELPSLIAPELAERLTRLSEPKPIDIMAALLEILGDALDGEDWGFPTNTRIHEPDVEIVKLLRFGLEPAIVREPTLVSEGHLFYVRRVEDRWIIVNLGGDDPGLAAYQQGTQS